jgi:hypothetical protein
MAAAIPSFWRAKRVHNRSLVSMRTLPCQGRPRPSGLGRRSRQGRFRKQASCVALTGSAASLRLAALGLQRSRPPHPACYRAPTAPDLWRRQPSRPWALQVPEYVSAQAAWLPSHRPNGVGTPRSRQRDAGTRALDQPPTVSRWLGEAPLAPRASAPNRAVRHTQVCQADRWRWDLNLPENRRPIRSWAVVRSAATGADARKARGGRRGVLEPVRRRRGPERLTPQMPLVPAARHPRKRG